MGYIRNTALNVGLFAMIQGLVLPAATEQQDKVRMCYFNSEAQLRSGKGKYTPGDVTASARLCTHIILAFAQIAGDGKSIEMARPNDTDFYQDIGNLKQVNPSLKVLLSLGGAGIRQTNAYVRMVNDCREKKAFIENAIRFLRQHDFDGLDVSWQYPLEDNRYQFQVFIGELWKAFVEEWQRSTKDKLLITLVIWPEEEKITNLYQPVEIQMFVDYFLLNTYNMWGMGKSKLGHHTSLYVRKEDESKPELNKLSVDQKVSDWVKAGGRKDKMVVGLATFGKTVTMKTPEKHNLGDTHSNLLATRGPFLKKLFILAYYEICQKLRATGTNWREMYVPETEGAIAYSTQEPLDWVCYDNQRSFRAKARYVLDKDLAGVFFWAMDYDDFRGEFCGEGRYPLLSAVKEVFDNNTASQSR